MIALTDGVDNRSTAKAETALSELLRHGVVLDSVLIGNPLCGLDLHAVAKLTGGHALTPESASKLLDVFENDACESESFGPRATSYRG